MKRSRRILKIEVLSLIGVVIVIAVAAYGLSELRVRKNYDIVLLTAAVSPEPHLVERGRHLAVTRGCTDCHTADLGGKIFMNDSGVAGAEPSAGVSGRGSPAFGNDRSAGTRALRQGRAPALLFRDSTRSPGGMKAGIQMQSTITCSQCGQRSEAEMPMDACLFFYECPGCKTLLRPLAGDCCVFCSYGTVRCPPKQSESACC
jgi:hypothetical protein